MKLYGLIKSDFVEGQWVLSEDSSVTNMLFISESTAIDNVFSNVSGYEHKKIVDCHLGKTVVCYGGDGKSSNGFGISSLIYPKLFEIDTSKYSEKLDGCFTGDEEVDHSNADDIIVELLNGLGMNDIADKYERVGKRYA